jgi:hypothetical protein
MKSKTKTSRKAKARSTRLLADAFIFKTRLPNGVEVEMDALCAEQLCEKLESFGDDCAAGCKRMRSAIRNAINTCKAAP